MLFLCYDVFKYYLYEIFVYFIIRSMIFIIIFVFDRKIELYYG